MSYKYTTYSGTDSAAAIIAGLFEDPLTAPTHNEKWDEITPAEAPLVRAAIPRAASMAILGIPPDEAYLRGIADALAYGHRRAPIETTFDGVHRFPEPPPK